MIKLNKIQILNQLKKDYPQFKFIKGNNYFWSSTKKAVYYRLPINLSLVLHELGHGVLGHTDYDLDIDLVKKEADAWRKAQQLAENYNLKIGAALIKSKLETYKNWLNKRSRCPNCGLIGIQNATSLNYSCINCHQKWSVPEDPQLKVKILSVQTE